MATMPTTLDPARQDAFTGKIVGLINNAGLSLMISIGHRTGLFDSLAKLPPSTADEIAAAAGLHPRYVREWLGAMVAGEIVELDAGTSLYRLPPEHAACLTRAAVPNNLAVVTQFVSVLGGVEDEIVECFHKGGGVPYERYPRFHEVMAEESDQSVGAALLDQILPLAEGVTEMLDAGTTALDVGCGSGYSLCRLAARFPNTQFVGYDFSEQAIARGRVAAARQGLTNVTFEVRDAAKLDEPGRFGLITAFDAIHDQARPDAVLAGIARSLAPGGTFLMQDIAGSCHHHANGDQPLAPFMYTISCMHCMTVSLANDGMGLGAMWGKETALDMLADAGFENVTVQQLEHDQMNYYYVAKRGS